MAKSRRKTGKKKRMRGWHVLAVILAASLILYTNRIGDAFGGFHGATNEAFYAELGRSIAKNPLSYPHLESGIIDNNIPPLTAYLLGFSFMAFGESEASARIVPIIFSLASTALIYTIGRRIYDKRTGLAAAAILAFTPMNVIVGRNVQTDPLFMALGLAGVYLYLAGGFMATGLILGAAFTAKQPAVLFLIGLAALELMKGRWRNVLTLSLGFALASSPYAAYNILQNGDRFIGGQASRIMLPVSEEGGGLKDPQILLNEAFWGLSPLIAAVFTLGMLYAAYRRRKEDTLPIAFCALFIAFFLAYNKHSYYLLPLAPFAALISARLLSNIKKEKLFAAAAALLAISGAFYSVLMLCGNKYGYDEYRRLPQLYDSGAKPVILIDELIAGNYIDGLRYYNPAAEIVNIDRIDASVGETLPVDYNRTVYVLLHRSEIKIEKLPKAEQDRLLKSASLTDRYSLVLFGIAIYEIPLNPHFFTNRPIHVSIAPPITTFGIIRVAQTPELYLIRIAPGERLTKSEYGSFTMVRA
ncbi:MAG: glycosyltransferase family 39 protein [Candidatus Altiarchaeota archaeon]